MKELYLVLLTFYLTAVLAQDERRRCGPNEVFDECGSACEPTCRNPNPEVCTLQCVAGCRCRTGFFRNDRNECVRDCNPPTRPPPTRPPPTRPPPTRPPTPTSCSQVRCPPGTQCVMMQFPCTRHPCPPPRPQCVQNRPPPPPPPPMSCSQVRCPPDTRCEMVAEPCSRQPCPPPSPKCVAVRPPPPPPPPPSCSQVICPSGTRCEMVAEPCTRQPCPPPRPICVAARPPPPPPPPPITCSNVRCPAGTHCEMVAQPCHRQPCAPPSPQCISNGQHRTRRSHHHGGRPPRPTTPPPTLPPPNCDNIRCPPGFLCQVISIPCEKPPCSPPTAQCFREQDVPPQPVRCPKNESWRNCSSRCEPTCDNRNPTCDKSCGKPKCQCDPGFVRNRSGKCVRPSNCPRRHGRK